MASSPILHLIMATIAIFGLLVAPQCAADNSLISPNVLPSGQALTTGDYALTMQPDCNLVLYRNDNFVWSSNSLLSGGQCRLTLQNNGNLVITDKIGRQVWQSGSAGSDGQYVLVLQQDGDVAVYGKQVWHTRTGPVHTVGLHDAAASVDEAAEQVIVSAVAGAMLK